MKIEDVIQLGRAEPFVVTGNLRQPLGRHGHLGEFYVQGPGLRAVGEDGVLVSPNCLQTLISLFRELCFIFFACALRLCVGHPQRPWTPCGKRCTYSAGGERRMLLIFAPTTSRTRTLRTRSVPHGRAFPTFAKRSDCLPSHALVPVYDASPFPLRGLNTLHLHHPIHSLHYPLSTYMLPHPWTMLALTASVVHQVPCPDAEDVHRRHRHRRGGRRGHVAG
jgi:hypothetical protein